MIATTRLRAYVVDDEPLAVERLTDMLRRTERVEVVGATTLPEEAVAAMSTRVPDVCFLDIQMPRLDGFAVLARLPEQPAIVFTTAHDRYALDAFAVNSVDYLLKPVEAEHLGRALDKIERLRRAAARPPQDVHALLARLEQALQRRDPVFLERIATRLGERLWFLDLQLVSHFFAADKLTYAVASGKAHYVERTIAELQEALDPRQFFRIHRATLVNIRWIKEITSLPGGRLNIRLNDAAQTDLVVARDRARELRSWLGS